MTFSTQRKLRLKLRINHCILMSLHNASPCLALSCFLSSSDMQSPHFRKRNIIKGGLHIILLICFLSEGWPQRAILENPFPSAKNWLNKKKFEILNLERKENHHPVIKPHNVWKYPSSKLFNMHGYQEEYKENVSITVKTYRHVYNVHRFYAGSLKRSFVPRCQIERTIETVHWHLFHCGRPSPDLWFDCPSNYTEYIEGSKYALEK